MVVPLAFGWRDLLFDNWRVDEAVLDAHLPAALEVQPFDGSGWLSVVPFVNVDTRPRGLPPRAGVDLPELNLRTYVTCDGEPGVYFFSLDADGLLAVLGARLTHHLPYYYARIGLRRHVGSRHSADGRPPDERERFPRAERVRFESRRLHPGDRPARYLASYGPTGEAFVPEPGTLAAFLTERRRLFTQATDGTIRYTDVSHEPWTLYPADATVRENTLFEANAFAHPGGEPVRYYSPGLDVVTSRSKRWSDRHE